VTLPVDDIFADASDVLTEVAPLLSDKSQFSGCETKTIFDATITSVETKFDRNAE